MPTTKEAYIRYRIIDRCLTDKIHQYPSKEYLRDQCIKTLGVNTLSLKTIEKDLYDMRHNDQLGFFAPIVYQNKGTNQGYYYTKNGYSINSIPLNTMEMNSLLYAANFLEHYKETYLFENFSATIEKIIDSLTITKNTPDKNAFNQVQFDKQLYKKGGKYFNELYIAIKEKKKGAIIYSKFNSKVTRTHRVEPKLLKEYNGIWYVVVILFINNSQLTTTFALDRIENFILSEENQETDFFEELSQYFNSCIGVTKIDSEPTTITLTFNQRQGNYIKLIPLHSSQSIVKDNEEGLTVTLNIIPNTEFYMKVLGYGNNLLAVEPEQVRLEIKSIASSLIKNIS